MVRERACIFEVAYVLHVPQETAEGFRAHTHTKAHAGPHGAKQTRALQRTAARKSRAGAWLGSLHSWKCVAGPEVEEKQKG